ncbi:uncharacterized protein LOC107747473 [Sinocyclocheilus rhinocerous]|uniref:uncharacterized protein LOC107747473 n=1 Tax=Sinocyclocheilus rhinocerous TaxID=307959 RepID=UPI0007B7BBBC|nr:PREDICTED: uncharacterized protein LOC107747473 [Sinocyclocheilus rhinocerous]
MDAGRDRPELTRSYEGPSLSDFDRGFCADQSLSLSAVSADGFLRPNKGIVLEYSEPNPAVAPCLNYSTSLLSPLVALNKNGLSPGSTLSTALSSPVQGKSSTPYERVVFQKPVLASSLDLSCVDLTTTHPSWEVSLVKAIVESPKSCLESTWSPINLSAQSLMWSGTPPHPNVSEELQRSWKEMVWQGSNQASAIPDLREERSSSNLAI